MIIILMVTSVHDIALREVAVNFILLFMIMKRYYNYTFIAVFEGSHPVFQVGGDFLSYCLTISK